MKDYITTVFSLIVGLLDEDKIILLALIGLGIILIWQLIVLITNFHRRFASKCRKISKFLTKNGLSADNYNQFLSLVAKMPQEFIRGYKTFEHASYGLPSDYIKRFDSIDVETNGGLLNHGKTLVKSAIYGWTIILALLSLALLGTEPLAGLSVAEAMVVPVLFLILAKLVYFVFNAIKQQQYKMAVDEFNEMIDIMNDKIENNDNLPGPDVLSELIESVPVAPEQPEPKIESVSSPEMEAYFDNVNNLESINNTYSYESANEETENVYNDNYDTMSASTSLETQSTHNDDVYTEQQLVEEVSQPAQELFEESSDTLTEQDVFVEETQQDNDQLSADNEDSEDENIPEENNQEFTEEYDSENKQEDLVEQITTDEQIQTSDSLIDINNKEPKETKTPTKKTKGKTQKQEEKEDEMEEKRGRGRPKKLPEGELVITNDKQFEEVLERAEKLMRKSEEALSGSQAKRVEKSLKELIDAMTRYKEEH